MTLRTQMAADVDGVFLNTDDFATAATFYPGGSTSSFAVVVVIADVDEQFVGVMSGTAESRRATATLSRAVVRAGILAIEGTARDADRGDRIIVPSGDPLAGTWFVDAAVADVGGALTLKLRDDTRYEAAGSGAVGTT